MSLFTLWAIFTLPSVVVGLTVLFGIAFAASVVFAIVRSLPQSRMDDFDTKLFKSTILKASIPLFVVVVILSLYPSEKQMLYIAGAYGVTNIERIEELPEKSVEYLIENMEEDLQDMRENTDE